MVNSASNDGNPYVGPRPFGHQDRDLFFGREKEVRKLSALIGAHTTVLLYAQSGAGKSSLINAGLIPYLEQESVQVLPPARVGLRLQGQRQVDLENIFVYNAIASLSEQDVATPGAANSLTAFFRAYPRPVDEFEIPINRVLIFDQFEELFTTYAERWQDRETFLEQLGYALADDPNLTILFAMRQEYIAEIYRYRHLLPNRLQTSFHLERLTQKGALFAVEYPLQQTQRHYAPGVAKLLVEELKKSQFEDESGVVSSKVAEYVEPVVLQVVCESLWRSLPANKREITTEDIEQYARVDDALMRYYESCIAQVVSTLDDDNMTRERLMIWFDKTLITPAGTRATVYQDEQTTGGLPNAAISVLENLHIIRGERQGNARWYELSHERFIAPIREANRVYLLEKERLEAEQQRIRAEKAERKFAGEARGVSAFISYSRRDMQATQRIYSVLENAEMQTWVDRHAINAGENWFNVIQNGIEESDNFIFLVSSNSLASDFCLQEAQYALQIGKRIVPVLIDDVVYGPRYGYDALPPDWSFLWTRSDTSGNVQQILVTLAVSADGERIVTGAQDGSLVLWDAEGEVLARADARARITALAFNPDDRTLLAGTVNGALRMFRVQQVNEDTIVLPEVRVLRGHTASVNSIIYADDGLTALSAATDGTINRWDAQDDLLNNYAPHDNVIAAVATLRRSDVISAAGGNFAYRNDARTGERLTAYRESASLSVSTSVAVNPDSSRAMIGPQLFDVTSGDLIATLIGNSPAITQAAFTPDSNLIVTAPRDGTLLLWDVDSGELLRQFNLPFEVTSDFAISADGREVIVAGQNEIIRLDLDTVQPLRRSRLPNDISINGLALNPADDDEVLIYTSSGTLLLLNANFNIMDTVEVDASALLDAAYSPDGRLLLVGTASGRVLLLDAETLAIIRDYNGSIDRVNALDWFVDGMSVVTASDSTLSRWHVPDYGADVVAWARANRHVPQVPCRQLEQYIAQACTIATDTPPIVPTAVRTLAPTATFTPSLTPSITPSPERTTTPTTTLTTTATSTITHTPTPGVFRCPGTLPTRLESSQTARVQPSQVPNHLRTGPGLNRTTLGLLQPNTVLTILDGPVCNDGFVWYQVQHGERSGWTAESGEGEYGLVPNNPTPDILEQLRAVDLPTRSVQLLADSDRLALDLTGLDNTTVSQALATGLPNYDYVAHANIGWGPGALEDNCGLRLSSSGSGTTFAFTLNRLGEVATTLEQAAPNTMLSSAVNTGRTSVNTLTLLVNFRQSILVSAYLNDVYVTQATLPYNDVHLDAVQLIASTGANSDETNCTFNTSWVVGYEQDTIPVPASPTPLPTSTPTATRTPSPTPTITPSLMPTPEPTELIELALPFERGEIVYNVERLLTQQGVLRRVAFSPDDRYLASAGAQGLTVWSTDGFTGRQALINLRPVRDFAFSPDSQQLIATESGLLRLFDLTTGEIVQSFSGHTDSITEVSFSPDGRFIAGAGVDAGIYVWDGQTSRFLRTFEGHNNLIRVLAFSPDGNLLASGSSDFTIRLWSLTSGESTVLNGHEAGLNSVAFSPDGRLLASGANDNTVRLWDAATGDLLCTYNGHLNEVRKV